MTRKAPSIKALMTDLRMTEEEATQAREAMHKGKLAAVKAKGFFGLEYVRSACGRAGFYYLNSGDTYSPTIVRRRGSDTYRISTLGGEIENLEKKGVYFD